MNEIRIWKTFINFIMTISPVYKRKFLFNHLLEMSLLAMDHGKHNLLHLSVVKYATLSLATSLTSYKQIDYTAKV